MPSILLDTHILAWWRFEPKKVGRLHAEKLRQAERSGSPLAISAITLREIVLMVVRKRIEIDISLAEWLGEIDANPLLTVLPITTRIALESVQLGEPFPKDPADQIIAATAKVHRLPLMTADADIRKSGAVLVI